MRVTPLKSSSSKSWKFWMQWRALNDRNIEDAAFWSSRRQPQLQPKPPEGEGGSRAFPHSFFFHHHPPHLLPRQHWLEFCRDSLGTLPFWLPEVLKLWAWRCWDKKMVILFIFALWFWETDLIKQDLLFLLYLSRALMSYSFLYESQTGPLDEKRFGTSIKELHCAFSASVFEVTNSLAVWRCKLHILLHTRIWEEVDVFIKSSVFTPETSSQASWWINILNFHIWKVRYPTGCACTSGCTSVTHKYFHTTLLLN